MVGSRTLKQAMSQGNRIKPNNWNNMQSWDKSDDKWAGSSWGWSKWKSWKSWCKPWSPCDCYEKTPSTTRRGKTGPRFSALLPTNVLSEETNANEDAGMLSRGTGGSDAQVTSEQHSAAFEDLVQALKCAKGARGDSFTDLPATIDDILKIESDFHRGFRACISFPEATQMSIPLCSQWRASGDEAKGDVAA